MRGIGKDSTASRCQSAIDKRKAMSLQDIVKYLMGLLILVFLLDVRALETTRGVGESRQSRRLFDLLLGRYRPCINCICGRANRGGARFLGGEFTDTHEFPWLANIHVKNTLLVSGILINDRYVLTSASQLIGATPPEVKVALGEYDRCQLDISSANLSVEAIISHPEFNYESRAHDLALIRLSRSTHFERRVSPICLPDPSATYLGQVGTLMGWTESNSGDVEGRTCRPRKLGLPILGRRECLRSGIQPSNYHEESGCVGVIGTNSIVCQNDVGTSILHRSYSGFYDLVGILSDINNCSNTLGTSLYTRVGPHLDWIYQKTRDACYCLKPIDIPEIKSLIFLAFARFIPLLGFHSISKRMDVSYGSPSYRYCECGRKNAKILEKQRIIGGNETSANAYPWVALILRSQEKTLPEVICGGSLINDRYVLTAAHCFRPKFSQGEMKVRLGEHDFCTPGLRSVTFSVEKLIKHPKYIETKRLLADVMLIKLNMKVTFNEFIRPICLPKSVGRRASDLKYGGRLGDVLGWGIGDTPDVSCVLRETKLLIYNSDDCAYRSFNYFCAGYPSKNRDTCSANFLKGDSGGPMQIVNEDGKYELIGITSAGKACGDPDSPGLYTDVAQFLPWIHKEVSRDSMFCWR